MGAVITFKSAVKKSATKKAAVKRAAAHSTGVKPASKDFIGTAYAQLEALGGFTARPEQEQLSRDVFLGFMEGTPYVAEAPTGTGKTLAYLIGALAAREATQAPVVVSTATIALQEQIASSDMPRLVKAGVLTAGRFAVAKGRGRYFCPKSAERFLEGREGEKGAGQHDMFNAGAADDASNLLDARRLMADWTAKKWDGDSDSLKSKTPKVWNIVKASSDTCLAKRCDMYDTCAFFRERAKLAAAEVIIANHDLVFADLAMSLEEKETGGVFPVARYMLVLDEAHHMADKAIKLGEAKLDALNADEGLKNLDVLVTRAFRLKKLSAAFRRKSLNAKSFDHTAYAEATRALRRTLVNLRFDKGADVLRFAKGEVPAALTAALMTFKGEAGVLAGALGEASQLIRGLKSSEAESAQESAILGELNAWLSRLKEAGHAADEFVSDKNLARWLSRKDDDAATPVTLRLHVSPLDGVELLTKILWNNDRCVPVMVSATLRDMNDKFDRFASATGLPAEARSRVFPYVLPYKNSTLCMPAMKNTPKDGGYQAEMEAKLLESIDRHEGTLILFNSRAMMLATVKGLEAAFGRDAVFVQDSMGMNEILARHKARLDAGKGSILLGVQKMAEGLDLPGKYCTHLVLTRLPFAVPDSPVEQERQEQIGSRYFGECMLPDTLLRLVQMVGRLVRRETDTGRITMLDSRLGGTAWGRRMLKGLPPFTLSHSLRPAVVAAPASASVHYLAA